MGNFNRDRGGRGGDRHGGGFNRGGDRRGSGHSFGRDRGERPTMHKAVCDACHQNCEVPFKPTGNKPIFCSDCFSKQGGGNRDRGGDRKSRFENAGSGSDNSKDILKGIKTLNYKIDELIKALGHNTPSEKTTEPEATPQKASNKKVAKKKATKKKTSKKSAGPKIVASKKTPKKKPIAKKPVKKKAAKKK